LNKLIKKLAKPSENPSAGRLFSPEKNKTDGGQDYLTGGSSLNAKDEELQNVNYAFIKANLNIEK